MDFPSNSNKQNAPAEPKVQQEKNLTKITTGPVAKRKPTFTDKIRNVFFGGELQVTAKYVATDVLLPAIKNLVVDATSKGIERVIYGESSPRRRMQNQPQSPRVSYNSPINRSYPQQQYQRGNPNNVVMLPDQPPFGGRGRKTQAVGEIILSTRKEAEDVLERLNDLIDKFDVASVADLCEITGLPSSYTDNNWGWANLAFVKVRQIREGFVIDFPPAESL